MNTYNSQLNNKYSSCIYTKISRVFVIYIIYFLLAWQQRYSVYVLFFIFSTLFGCCITRKDTTLYYLYHSYSIVDLGRSSRKTTT